MLPDGRDIEGPIDKLVSGGARKVITHHRNRIARLRKDLKRARRNNVLGLKYFERRAKETIKAREEIIDRFQKYVNDWEYE